MDRRRFTRLLVGALTVGKSLLGIEAAPTPLRFPPPMKFPPGPLGPREIPVFDGSEVWTFCSQCGIVVYTLDPSKGTAKARHIEGKIPVKPDGGEIRAGTAGSGWFQL
jgi:hypothetical protein